jgi:hypothetical protein
VALSPGSATTYADARQRVRPQADIVVALLVIVVHAVLVWGYTGTFWGDFGRWSYEVERFASGEVPYRDFQWHFPPLGIWVFGGAARLIGTDLLSLSIIATSVMVLFGVCYSNVARRVLGRADAPLLGVCLVLALAFAQQTGAPLTLGGYTPAVPVGALCLFATAWCFLQGSRAYAHKQEGFARSDLWTGVFAALAVLSKQDFWIPAAYLVVVSTIRSRQRTTVLAASLVLLAGIGAIVATAGAQILRPLAGGFGHAGVTGGGGFPSWERLVVDAFVLALWCGGILLLSGLAQRRLAVGSLLAIGAVATLLGAVHVYASMHVALPPGRAVLTPTQGALAFHIRAGNSLLRPAIGWLWDRIVQNAIPVSLAPLLLCLLRWRWTRLQGERRAMLATLLGLAVAMRMRRAFGGAEWFEMLLMLPLVQASAELLLDLAPPALQRFRLSYTGALTVGALAAYVWLGRGPGTFDVFPAVQTARGTVHWPVGKLRDYRRILAQLDSIDPSRSRPLLAFGYTGGFNYFLQRRDPYPMTQDFYFSAFDADSVLRHRPPRLLLLDNPFLESESWGTMRFAWRRWEQSRVRGPYGWFDRPRFERLRAGCTAVLPSPTAFTVYACP